jgi:hypothetical protein
MKNRRRDPESRYKVTIQKQQRVLEEFAAFEIEGAEDLLRWYRLRGRDMPDDEYRAAVFFKNREFLLKPGSLTLLYTLHGRMMEELPAATKETAFDLMAYRFKVNAEVLKTGGFS